MRALSFSETKILKASTYVSKITESQIVFTSQFKSLLLANIPKGKTRLEFFNEILGVACFDKKYVDSCLNRWRRQLKSSGKFEDRRGKTKNRNNMSVEELKAENAYMKEVIAHLKKLHGLAEDDL